MDNNRDTRNLQDLLHGQERYINPYTDFGFKKLFGTEMNKDLLISFLNSLFNDKQREITDVSYLNPEHLGDGYGDRRAVFDVYCTTASGARFIVEMQKAEQEYFKDRSLYYSTFAIREQASKGQQWDYHLEDVYTIGVLNFKFPDNEYPVDKYRHEIKLKDVEDNHVFYDKLTFVYLEMPKFNKTADEVENPVDAWLYVLKHAHEGDPLPDFGNGIVNEALKRIKIENGIRFPALVRIDMGSHATPLAKFGYLFVGQGHGRAEQIVLTSVSPAIIEAEIEPFIAIHHKGMAPLAFIHTAIVNRTGEIEFGPDHIFPDILGIIIPVQKTNLLVITKITGQFQLGICSGGRLSWGKIHLAHDGQIIQ